MGSGRIEGTRIFLRVHHRLLQLGRRRAPDRAGLNGWFPHIFFMRIRRSYIVLKI